MKMEGKRLIEKIRLRNILSFGDRVSELSLRKLTKADKMFRLADQGEVVELMPLNVIIGQNASGKSNLIDVIRVLSSLPEDKGISNFVSRNGGILEWIWKGTAVNDFAEVETILGVLGDKERFRYCLKFSESGQRIFIVDEEIEYLDKNSIIKRNGKKRTETGYSEDSLVSPTFPFDGEFDWARFALQRILPQMRFFTDLNTNRGSEIRKPQLPDAQNDFLSEDASNLSLVLNDLELRGIAKDTIVENLRKFYSRVKDYSVRILGGTVQLFIREENLVKPISAMRLSDGTLRYLCLLAILCHPDPPPLICIEEPEIGLHPDILPTIAELLIEASKRTQFIVTTHSDILVSALSEVPEAVLVCEYEEENGTHFRRLEKDALKDWLEEYSLGELWLKGEIGGTRW